MKRGLLVLLLLPWLLAFGGNDRLELDLQGGVTARGWYVRIEGDTLVLSGANTTQAIPVALVQGVTLNDVPISLASFLERVDAARAAQEAAALSRRRAAAPGLAAGLSFGLAGAGHLAVGEPREAIGWMLLDGTLLAAGAWTLLGERSVGAALPILGLDLLVKVAAASDAARLGRRVRGRSAQRASHESSLKACSLA